jgi:succinoglycan biosynthesis transport protein ExoP
MRSFGAHRDRSSIAGRSGLHRGASRHIAIRSQHGKNMRPKMQAYVPTRFTNNSTQRLRTRVGLNESRCARRLAGTSGANDEGVEIVDLSRLLRLVQTGRRQIMGCIALMLCLAAAAALLVPPKYTALASVLVDVRGVDPLRGAVAPNSPLQKSVLATHASLLRSGRVARRVVTDLKLQDDPALRAAWHGATGGQGDLVDWVAERLLAHLEARPAEADSNVIEIKATDRDARRAEQLANGFAAAYLDSLTELRAQPARQTSSFFEEQARPLRERLESAQAVLAAFQRDNGIVNGATGQLDIETAQLNELATQLTGVRTQRIDSQSRANQASRNATNSPDVALDPVVQQLRVQVAVAESKLKELSGRLGREHPDYQTATEELGQLRRELGGAVGRAASTVGGGGSVGAEREASLKTALDAQRRKVLELTEQRDRMQVLARDVENAQKIYDQALQRGSESALDGRLQFSEATLVTPAVAPVQPSSPGPVLLAALAVIVGGALGVLTVLLREMAAPRVRGAEDLERLALEPLAVLDHARLRRPRRGLFGLGGPRRRSLPAPAPALPGWSTS